MKLVTTVSQIKFTDTVLLYQSNLSTFRVYVCTAYNNLQLVLVMFKKKLNMFLQYFIIVGICSIFTKNPPISATDILIFTKKKPMEYSNTINYSKWILLIYRRFKNQKQCTCWKLMKRKWYWHTNFNRKFNIIKIFDSDELSIGWLSSLWHILQL